MQLQDIIQKMDEMGPYDWMQWLEILKIFPDEQLIEVYKYNLIFEDMIKKGEITWDQYKRKMNEMILKTFLENGYGYTDEIDFTPQEKSLPWYRRLFLKWGQKFLRGGYNAKKLC
jgi:hypothetical protein